MKHAKRMVLVPEDVLSRIETSPVTAGMMHQDTTMSEILGDKSLSDAEKQKLYNANMENYLSLRKQKDQHVPTVRMAQTAEEGEKEASQSDADVIAHLPATQRSKAAMLLKRLRANPVLLHGTSPVR
jgi:hypothetical protein